jgi:hypothetical protein
MQIILIKINDRLSLINFNHCKRKFSSKGTHFSYLFRARCSVLYLGTAIPSEDERGIDSIQEPLSKRYPIDGTGLARGKKF